MSLKHPALLNGLLAGLMLALWPQATRAQAIPEDPEGAGRLNLPQAGQPVAVAKKGPSVLTLHDLIVDAINNNLEIKAKRLDPVIQSNRLLSARGAFDPSWVLGYNFSDSERAQNQRESMMFAGLPGGLPIFKERSLHLESGIAGKVTTGAQYQLLTSTDRLKNTVNSTLGRFFPEYQSNTTLTLVQPLLKDFGSNANLAEIRLQTSARKASRYEMESTVLKVLRDVSSAYFEMVFAQENIRVKQEAVNVAKKLVEENTRRYEEGRMAPIDVTQAKGRVAEALEELLLANNFLAQRRNTLQELTRERFDPSETRFTVDPAFMLQKAPAVNRAEARATMFRKNPSFLASLEVAKGEEYRIIDARNQTKPRVDLKASVGMNGLRGDFYDSYANYQNRTQPSWGAGLMVNIPIGNHLARGRLAESLNRKSQAGLNVQKTELTLDSAFDSALRDIANATERVKLVGDSVRLARAAAEAETLRLASGKTTSYNVSQTLRDLSQAASRELASFVDLNKALIQFEFIVGTLPEHLRIELR